MYNLWSRDQPLPSLAHLPVSAKQEGWQSLALLPNCLDEASLQHLCLTLLCFRLGRQGCITGLNDSISIFLHSDRANDALSSVPLSAHSPEAICYFFQGDLTAVSGTTTVHLCCHFHSLSALDFQAFASIKSPN